MADVSKLKGKARASTLGAPPSLDEASNNLTAPEVAPAAPMPAPVRAAAPAPGPAASDGYQRRDARAARRTGRTLPFATRVSQEFDQQMRDIAERDGLKLAELLELALAAYEAQQSR
ncbi:hypothetical protein ABQW55_022850 (plasmid) [Xanthomonas citri pv. malvacearum]|uniref:Stability/partitioning determinant n=2 Tax=Xanthomonas TaxID=338 RepID=A0AA44YYC5_XANCM|nr:hypothetical protein [Xanthomonas citri]ASN03475.1 hypothetical protein APY29_22575 [Xanthomonas citri pv. malvacearum]ASY86980.1 hypothetical protein CIW71_24150 [Xanthomonas citri pv. malvacearum]NMI15850.1 hypothetical protein [Xanthomonas citri]OOX00734.1 hypothetical protein Xmlv_20620 [Xanthomonas citri pv. malvacearum]PUE89667.1 hypothetical protein C7T86_23270 [Xanthomonas citri pv. malvacearum]